MTKVLHHNNHASVLKSGLIALSPTITMTSAQPVFAIQHGIQSDDSVTINNGSLQTSGQLGGNGVSGSEAFNQILGKIRLFVLGFAGFAVLAMLASFTLHALELAFSSGNPAKRSQHVQSLGIDFGVMAFLGGLSWIAGIAYNTV